MSSAIPVLINAAAGTGHSREEIAKLEQLFREAGAEARIVPARNGQELVELAQRLGQEGHPIIVAGGGDGTINAVASVVAGTDIALGILPLGTLNHFAKDLNIPLDVGDAVRTIVTGRRVNVDVGEVNGRIFVNNSSLGLYPHIVLERKTLQRRLGRSKWSALFWATLNVMRRGPLLDVLLRLRNEARRYRAPLVFIGNNEYVMEGFNVGKRDRLDAGVLSIYVTQRRGRLALVGLALRALVGRLHQARDFEALTADTAEINTRRHHVHVATDGEVTVMDKPLNYRIRPRDLCVLVAVAEPAKSLT